MSLSVRSFLRTVVLASLPAGCTTLVAAYDPVFDTTLNGLSEKTAIFVAAAEAGGAERQFTSKPTTEYYAAVYNVLDRLIARAKTTRGPGGCPATELLKSVSADPLSATPLPDDYLQLDCREVSLYAVRLNVDQLQYFHRTSGQLNRDEADATGYQLQRSIMGAILTFLNNKPE